FSASEEIVNPAGGGHAVAAAAGAVAEREGHEPRRCIGSDLELPDRGVGGCAGRGDPSNLERVLARPRALVGPGRCAGAEVRRGRRLLLLALLLGLDQGTLEAGCAVGGEAEGRGALLPLDRGLADRGVRR